jgi:hypothetical protein
MENEIVKTITGVIFLLLLAVSGSAQGGIINADSVSRSDVAAAIHSAVNGDTVVIPAGASTWTTGISVSRKAIKIQGAGSGRIIGRSRSSVGVGTGSKTFATQAGLSISAGQILTIESMPLANGTIDGRGTYMTGKVTSYSGTSLVMNITVTGGSGTHDFWKIETQASTTINHRTDSNTVFALVESTAGSIEISGIRFTQLVDPTGNGTKTISVANTSGGKPVLIHDCWFSEPANNLNAIDLKTNRGVIWNCSFDASPFGMTSGTVGLKWEGGAYSWTTSSTMGAADTTGVNNVYVEDCDYHAFLNAGGIDDNGRMVLRHCLFDNAGFGTHGADTSKYGQRHFEVYDSEFVFNSTTGDVLNLNWWFFIRGGTFIVTDCIMPLISSQDYSNKRSFNMTVMNLQRRGGPNPCWGGGTRGGAKYPAPRQVGMGRVTGTAGYDSITYVGDSEPAYIWNITGSTPSINVSDYGGNECTNPDTSANYIRSGRDYHVGTPKPGYQKYTYPHPLRSQSSPPTPSITPSSLQNVQKKSRKAKEPKRPRTMK